MNTANVIAIAAAAIALLSAGAGIATFVAGRRDRAADAAARERERTEDKRERAEHRDLVRRHVETVETAERREQQRTVQPVVDWSIEHAGGSLWHVRNVGSHSAGTMRVTGVGGSEDNLTIVDESQLAEVVPFGVVEVMITEDFGSRPPSALHITCDECPQGWTKPVRR